MTRIVVNDQERPSDPALRTWGDLLGVLDRELLEQGHLVTVARFDGVEEPTFREPAAMARALGDVTEVAVQTDRPTALVNASLDDVGVAVGALGAAASRIGTAFRGHDLAAANKELVTLADGLRMLVAAIRTLADLLEVDLAQVESGGQKGGASIEAVGSSLESLIEAHQAEDWVSVADVLEYDIEPALRGWQPMLDALRERVADQRS